MLQAEQAVCYPSLIYASLRVEQGSSQLLQKLYACDLERKTSFALPPLIPRLCDRAIVMIEGTIYVIGGKNEDGFPSKSLFSFDAVEMTWVQRESTMTLRKGAVAVVADGNIFTFGGYKSHPQHRLPWAEKYSPSLKKWVGIRNPGKQYKYFCEKQVTNVAVLGNDIFITAGDEGISLSLISGKWSRMQDSLKKKWVKSCSAIELAGKLVGYYQQVLHDDDAAQAGVALGAYDPATQLWVPINGLRTQFNNPEVWDIFCLHRQYLVLYKAEAEADPAGYGVTFMVTVTSTTTTEDRPEICMDLRASHTCSFPLHSDSDSDSTSTLMAAHSLKLFV